MASVIRRVRYVLTGVLYVVLALFVVVGFAGDFGLLNVPGLLIAALVIAVALLGMRWSERRVERKRLVHEYGLSAYDARMAMHLVDSGQVMRAALRPAGRDYAQCQLDHGPTPGVGTGPGCGDGCGDVSALRSTSRCAGLRPRGDRLRCRQGPSASTPRTVTDDLFAQRVRPNTLLAPQDVYETKTTRWIQQWPSLLIEPWPD